VEYITRQGETTPELLGRVGVRKGRIFAIRLLKCEAGFLPFDFLEIEAGNLL
jgi:hypothetical protein